MSMSAFFCTLLLVGCAAYVALYATFLFVRRVRQGDKGLRSFGVWLRDLFDVTSGLG